MIYLLDLGSSMIKRKGENLLNCGRWCLNYEFNRVFGSAEEGVLLFKDMKSIVCDCEKRLPWYLIKGEGLKEFFKNEKKVIFLISGVNCGALPLKVRFRRFFDWWHFLMVLVRFSRSRRPLFSKIKYFYFLALFRDRTTFDLDFLMIGDAYPD